jgi:hypothetical protein
MPIKTPSAVVVDVSSVKQGAVQLKGVISDAFNCAQLYLITKIWQVKYANDSEKRNCTGKILRLFIQYHLLVFD